MNETAANTEASVYIIDSEYRLVYINDRLKRFFPELQLGEFCYHSLCMENFPCLNCPAAKQSYTHAIFYNKSVQCWIDVSTGEIDWPEHGPCHIMLAKTVDEGSKNLFYNLTSLSPYDELFELNLTNNTYKLLYYLPDKYVLPGPGQDLPCMIRKMADHTIHPEDRSSFLQFLNTEHILSCIPDDSSRHLLTGEFRRLQPDGGYCWVLYTIVPITYSENGDHVVMCFIQDIHTQKLKELSNQQLRSPDLAIHPLTGLYRKNVFFQLAEEFLRSRTDSGIRYCLMAIDIEHFKLFNEWYGTSCGDDFLINISRHLKRAQEEHNGIAGYIGNDDFAIILPCREEILNDLQNDLIAYIQNSRNCAGFLPAFGLYVIEDLSLTVNAMYDRACMALTSIKGNYARRCAQYDKGIMQRMERDHVLLSEVQRALTNHEFTFYAQPKCNMATGRIIGLESLVRWNHPTRGLIPPGDFIPLLESNGFISNLDLYIWEKVCIALRGWMDRGNRPIPISVNVSRIDIYTMDVAEVFRNLVEKYQIEPRLLEIEITESAYTEDYHIITGVVENLRSAGFTILMDDFGSGYSSLNMLKDVNVDIIKLDMKFLDMNDQTAGKSIGILEAVINMAHLMNLRIIAEGIETQEQVQLLLDMGCLYGQGYYFYHPMPVEVFEPLLLDARQVDYRGLQARSIDYLGAKQLLNEDLFSEAILNNILGAIALYDVHDKTVELLRANEQYYKVTQTNPVDLAERSQQMLFSIHPDDHARALRIFERAVSSPLNGAEGELRKCPEDGEMIWLRLHAFFLREQNGHGLFYCALTDITEQKQKELLLASLLSN